MLPDMDDTDEFAQNSMASTWTALERGNCICRQSHEVRDITVVVQVYHYCPNAGYLGIMRLYCGCCTYGCLS